MEQSFLSSTLLPIALAVIMFGMGLSLTLADFKRIFKYPKAVFIGSFNQLVLLPLIAYGLILLFGITGGVAVGVMIVAACPGGTTSNIITHLSKGDTALSVSLTAISSLVTTFTIPLIVGFALKQFMGADSLSHLPFGETFGKLIKITIIPVVLAMVLRHYKKEIALRMDRPVRIASFVIFLAILIALILKHRNEIGTFFLTAGSISIALNVLTMSVGFLAAYVFKLSSKQGVTIAIESGIQNGTLALLVAGTLIDGATMEMSVAPAIYSLLMFVSGALVMSIFSKKLS